MTSIDPPTLAQKQQGAAQEHDVLFATLPSSSTISRVDILDRVLENMVFDRRANCALRSVCPAFRGSLEKRHDFQHATPFVSELCDYAFLHVYRGAEFLKAVTYGRLMKPSELELRGLVLCEPGIDHLRRVLSEQHRFSTNDIAVTSLEMRLVPIESQATKGELDGDKKCDCDSQQSKFLSTPQKLHNLLHHTAHGICKQHLRTLHLDLSHQHLSATAAGLQQLSPAIFPLPALEELTLDGCNMGYIEDNYFDDVPNTSECESGTESERDAKNSSIQWKDLLRASDAPRLRKLVLMCVTGQWRGAQKAYNDYLCCNAGLMFEGVFEHLEELRVGGNILLMAPMAEQPEAAKRFPPLVWKEADDGARFQMRKEPHTNIRALKYLNNFDTHFPKLRRFTHNFPTAPQPEYMPTSSTSSMHISHEQSSLAAAITEDAGCSMWGELNPLLNIVFFPLKSSTLEVWNQLPVPKRGFSSAASGSQVSQTLLCHEPSWLPALQRLETDSDVRRLHFSNMEPQLFAKHVNGDSALLESDRAHSSYACVKLLETTPSHHHRRSDKSQKFYETELPLPLRAQHALRINTAALEDGVRIADLIDPQTIESITIDITKTSTFSLKERFLGSSPNDEFPALDAVYPKREQLYQKDSLFIMPQLTSLDIRAFISRDAVLSEEDMQFLAQSCPALEHMSFCGFNLSTGALAAMEHLAPRTLKSMDLFNWKFENKDGSVPFAMEAAFSNKIALQSLFLSCCRDVSLDGLAQLPNLKSVCVGSGFVTEKELLKLHGCQSLKVLAPSFQVEFSPTMDEMKSLIHSLPNLELLSLLGCGLWKNLTSRLEQALSHVADTAPVSQEFLNMIANGDRSSSSVQACVDFADLMAIFSDTHALPHLQFLAVGFEPQGRKLQQLLREGIAFPLWSHVGGMEGARAITRLDNCSLRAAEAAFKDHLAVLSS